MMNGEWGMGNGEWRMGNGEWGVKYKRPRTAFRGVVARALVAGLPSPHCVTSRSGIRKNSVLGNELRRNSCEFRYRPVLGNELRRNSCEFHYEPGVIPSCVRRAAARSSAGL